MTKTLHALLFGLLSFPAGSAHAQALAGVFADHMVVQRDAAIPVWGTAAPGAVVAVDLAGSTAETIAGEDGSWAVELAPLPAGGPHALTVLSSTGVTQIEDVVVGDVYLCTGQSNMVLQVARTTAGPFEAMRATDSRIRMATVPNVASPVPLGDYADPLDWQVASPETVPNWSGACYYFGRDLRSGPLAADDVPVGLITAAWGGSGIRSWMSEAAVESVGGYEAALAMLREYTEDRSAAQQAFGVEWEAWWLERSDMVKSDAPWQPASGATWPSAPEGLGDWSQWDDLRGFTGMVWFRATVDLTEEQASQDAQLALGAIDEVDQTWINGQVVANTFGYGSPRTYPLGSDQLRAGQNVVVLNVLNTWAAGGLTGDHSLRVLHLADGTRIPLEDWRYLPVRDGGGFPPRAPWESVGGLTTIHNAMVAPLRHTGLSGVLWYQGESDTDDSGAYADLLTGLMHGWRQQFRRPRLPVGVVQLPNFGAVPTHAVESGWAEIREAQRIATARDLHAGLAVTIEVGDPRDLHPPNKQAVGRRLARVARNLVYGEPIAPSGPVPRAVRRDGDVVVVSFGDVEGSLLAYGGAGPIGFALCGSERGSCRYADARVRGPEVHVQVEDGKPLTRIRYAWADSPIVTLFDGSGLPVGPFEMAVVGTGSKIH